MKHYLLQLTLALTLAAPVPAALRAQQPGAKGQVKTYTVQPGETFLGVAHRHGTTLDRLRALNPSVDPDHIEVGQQLVVPVIKGFTPEPAPVRTPVTAQPAAKDAQPAAKAAQPAQPVQPVEVATVRLDDRKTQPQVTYKEYKVKKKDTAYSLAKANGITVDELFEANPALKAEGYQLKKGTLIRIPVKAAQPAAPAYKGLATVRAAVLLPFSGDKLENVRSVEFYRGLLMGLTDLKARGVSLDIRAYNEPAGDVSVLPLLQEVMQGEPDVIVGPLYPTHFADVTRVASRTTKVAIPFSSKVPQVDYQPGVYVINTPAYYEATPATELFLKCFKPAETGVIILHDQSGDKKAFSEMLQSRLIEGKYAVTALPLTASASDLQQAVRRMEKPGVILVPDNSSEAALRTVLDKQAALKALMPSLPVSLMGYEQWIGLSERGYRDRLHAADTYLLTPNYYYPYTASAISFATEYERQFGTGLLEAQPKMGPLGYDFSHTFLAGLSTYGYDYTTQRPAGGKAGTPEVLQTDLRFLPVKGGGYISRSMWLVRFKPDGAIVKIAAK